MDEIGRSWTLPRRENSIRQPATQEQRSVGAVASPNGLANGLHKGFVFAKICTQVYFAYLAEMMLNSWKLEWSLSGACVTSPRTTAGTATNNSQLSEGRVLLRRWALYWTRHAIRGRTIRADPQEECCLSLAPGLGLLAIALHDDSPCQGSHATTSSQNQEMPRDRAWG